MRHSRLVAAATIAAALVAPLALTSCSSGGGTDTASGKLEGRGPITFVTGKDTSGNRQKQLDAWNKAHPKEQAKIIELPEDADAQRQQMSQNAQAKSDAYSVLNLDVVWTAEFAGKQWIEPLPEDQFPLNTFLAPTVETAKYFKKLYAVPLNSDGALLYYRKDLLTAAGITKAPTTWAEMQAACTKVQATNKTIGCYAGQFNKYEGLTVNFSEAVNSAGGEVVGADGKPNVNTPAAKKGLDFLVNGFKPGGYIPAKAQTFKEEEARRDFQDGNLLFERNWPYTHGKFSAADGSSKVNGKFEIAPIPGLTGPGTSTLGGHNLAISKFAKNKASALDFIKFITSKESQTSDLKATSQAATIASVYDDPALVKQYPYLPILKKSILAAKKRPEAVKYNEVSTAIQDAAYAAIRGEKTSDVALKELQAKLVTATKTS